MAIPRPDIAFERFTLAHVPAEPEPYHLLNRVPILDNGEPLVDLRETNPELSFGDYCLPYVREGIAEALRAATAKLPDHFDLRVYTALRTPEQQAEMYWRNYKAARVVHPEWPESTVRRMTNRFFAPPDSKAPPGHCTGGAVDVGLHHRETEEGIDVRSPLEGWKGAPTAVRGLNPESAENRRLLCYLMHSTGLSNCRDEFWHWSYGDSAWAARTGAPVACYGLVEPPDDHSRVSGGRIVLAPYDQNWPSEFEAIKRSHEDAHGALILGIEHVGSTSVPGMAAKPILDIYLVVADSEAMAALIQSLDTFGYEHQGDLGIEGREAFRAKQMSEPQKWPAHNVSACIENNDELRRQLALRDHLRGNQADAAAYVELKRNAAARHPWDRVRYTDLKDFLIEELLTELGSRARP